MNILLKKAAYTIFISMVLFACNTPKGDGGEEIDKGKVLVVNVAPNLSRKPGTITYRFKPASGKSGDSSSSNLIDQRVMLKINGRNIRNTPMAINGYERYRAYTPGTLLLSFDTTLVANGAGQSTPPTKIGRILDHSMPIEANKYYSVFLVDSLQKPTVWVLNDTLSLPSKGKAKVRVLNLSFDAGPIDMYFTSRRDGIQLDSRLFIARNLPYKTNRGYIEVPAGMYDVEARKAGSGGNSFISLKRAPETKFRTYPFDSNSVYTIWFTGVVSKNSFTARVLPGDATNPRFNIIRSNTYPQAESEKSIVNDIYMIANRWTIPR